MTRHYRKKYTQRRKLGKTMRKHHRKNSKKNYSRKMSGGEKKIIHSTFGYKKLGFSNCDMIENRINKVLNNKYGEYDCREVELTPAAKEQLQECKQKRGEGTDAYIEDFEKRILFHNNKAKKCSTSNVEEDENQPQQLQTQSQAYKFGMSDEDYENLDPIVRQSLESQLAESNLGYEITGYGGAKKIRKTSKRKHYRKRK